MKKRNFIFKSLLIVLAYSFIFANPSHENNFYKSNSKKSKTLSVLPANVLKRAYVVFATPSNGDGKEDNGSIVDVEADIHLTDGKIYTANGEFGDSTDISPNEDRIMEMKFKGGADNIIYEDVNKLVIKIRLYKGDANWFRRDSWNFRRELILEFKNGKIISSGYNDPAYFLAFEAGVPGGVDAETIEKPHFLNKRTLVPPY